MPGLGSKMGFSRRIVLSVCVGATAAAALPAGSTRGVRALEKKYSIRVQAEALEFPVATTHGKITGTEASPRVLAAFLPLLVSEFSLYPPELIERSRLERIVVCRDLAFAGQKRTALPDFEHQTLYLDAVRGDDDPIYQRKVIHHEFFHVIDWLDDHQLYRDDGWASLNPDGFRYGRGGAAAQGDASMSILTDEHPGFLNRYSRTGVEEDKAEIFANMIVNPVVVEKRAAGDAVLRRKTERMAELLEKFCPEVDESFWASVRRVKR